MKDIKRLILSAVVSAAILGMTAAPTLAGSATWVSENDRNVAAVSSGNGLEESHSVQAPFMGFSYPSGTTGAAAGGSLEETDHPMPYLGMDYGSSPNAAAGGTLEEPPDRVPRPYFGEEFQGYQR